MGCPYVFLQVIFCAYSYEYLWDKHYRIFPLEKFSDVSHLTYLINTKLVGYMICYYLYLLYLETSCRTYLECAFTTCFFWSVFYHSKISIVMFLIMVIMCEQSSVLSLMRGTLITSSMFQRPSTITRGRTRSTTYVFTY